MPAPYLTDIREIQEFVSNDLPSQGIESIKPVAQTAVTDGDKLKETIKPVLTAIDQVKADMNQGGMNKEHESSGDQKQRPREICNNEIKYKGQDRRQISRSEG